MGKSTGAGAGQIVTHKDELEVLNKNLMKDLEDKDLECQLGHVDKAPCLATEVVLSSAEKCLLCKRGGKI